MTTKSLFHQKADYTKYVKIFPDKLPEKTNIWCWWCCHSFDSYPVALPAKYDDVRDSFLLVGTFCSFSCCKAYMLYSSIYNKPTTMCNIKVLAKRMGCEYKQSVIPAPPRETLNVFGGYLTIEEFRNKTKNRKSITLLPSKHYIQTQNYEEKIVFNYDQKSTKTHVEEKQEKFALKRTKPLKKAKGTLEESMGLVIK